MADRPEIPAWREDLIVQAADVLPSGLDRDEVARRQREFGPNTLPPPQMPSLAWVFLSQFKSPLIYILLAAVVVSLALGDVTDAAFIAVVLIANGSIGAIQESSAGRAVVALRRLERTRARVIREGTRHEIDAAELVPGDLVELEAGMRVPADLTLLAAHDLRSDESLLTGESRDVHKRSEDAAFAGTVVTRGRGRGLIAAIGAATQMGLIAAEIGRRSLTEPPLMIRIRRLSTAIAYAVGVAIVVLVMAGLARQIAPVDLFLMAVGLAVSAIPEGLPVAISVALSIAMRRMANVNVIVRHMPAVEALGSCTMIATDKTGTLTMNRLAVTDIVLPDGARLEFHGRASAQAAAATGRLLRTAMIANEGRLGAETDPALGEGDAVDLALLAAGRTCGLAEARLLDGRPAVARIPYEPDIKFAASFHREDERLVAFVKGAPESVMDMCVQAASAEGVRPIDRTDLLRLKEMLARDGLRVLAFAEGVVDAPGAQSLRGLTFLGFAGMRDPIRPEVPAAIAACARASVDVVMITGDDPTTARAIGREAGLCDDRARVVTGDEVATALGAGEAVLDRLVTGVRLFARIAPTQKLAIVLALVRQGHFVAVTGDGVNDAPALRHAHVGVAMGRSGAEVAKESADIILTDDNFATIVAGIREGRVAYANIRKVVFMLLATGAAEVMLFLLAMAFAMPMPLLPVQLLWLNLVTNGIQDVALAFEPAEGDELKRPPRRPAEPLVDRPMIRRILWSVLVMGCGGFAVFAWMIANGMPEAQARNLLLLLFVLFENVQTLNARSERHSLFARPPFGNPLLIAGVVGAHAIHIAAMFLPGLSTVLQVQPVGLWQWTMLVTLALVLLAADEAFKWRTRRMTAGPIRGL